MRVSDLLEGSARRYPHRRAVSDAEKSLTYAEYRARAQRVANATAGTGLRPGDRVAVILHNSVTYAEVIMGLALGGFVAVHIPDRLAPDEIAHILLDSDSQTAIVDAEMARTLAGAIQFGGWEPAQKPVSVGDSKEVPAVEYESWLARADARPTPHTPEPVAPFYLGYTSGTTGKPKGARITHSSRVLTAIAACVEYGLTPQDVTLMCTPMHHGGPLVFVLTSVAQGGELVIMPRFDAENALRLIDEKGITSTFVVPTILSRLAAAKPTGARSPLRTLISNAAPLPTVVKEATFASFPGVALHEFYGSTEAGIVTNLRPEDQLRKVRCAGQPFLLTEVAILNDHGERLPAGDVGEVFSRSPYLFDGYQNLPEASAQSTRDGMVSAGDLGRFDDEGYLYVVDRKHDMIISGGVNIYPREIEETLLSHPTIAEVAVIGVPDPEWGERVKAFVVLTNGGLDVDAVVAEASEALSDFKRPRLIEAREELPRNSTGKLLKRQLRDEAWRGQEANI